MTLEIRGAPPSSPIGGRQATPSKSLGSRHSQSSTALPTRSIDPSSRRRSFDFPSPSLQSAWSARLRRIGDTMAAAVKAINAKIRSNKVLDYFCSTRMSTHSAFDLCYCDGLFRRVKCENERSRRPQHLRAPPKPVLAMAASSVLEHSIEGPQVRGQYTYTLLTIFFAGRFLGPGV